MKGEFMNNLLCRQLALDYCCREEEVRDKENHFTEFSFPEGRRRFREEKDCFLKMAIVNGKLLASGNASIIGWCEKEFGKTTGEWFFEPETLRIIDRRLQESGYMIGMLHPFYISETISAADTKDYEIRWYEGEDIEQFRGDRRFKEAYSFCEEAPDVLGVGAVRNGNILGMAGASADSPIMWQIGINVMPEAEGLGIAKMLVRLLKNEILSRGIQPFYGTAISHLASQSVALGSGFHPAWIEFAAKRITTGASGETEILIT